MGQMASNLTNQHFGASVSLGLSAVREITVRAFLSTDRSGPDRTQSYLFVFACPYCMIRIKYSLNVTDLNEHAHSASYLPLPVHKCAMVRSRL
jgi:hypothetical protein